VMYGHINTTATRTGVFSQLHRLRVGNRLVVTDRKKAKRTFEVVAVKRYPTSQLPLREITGKSTSAKLNLYTCTGWWNPGRRDYSHRLVVYTKLVANTPQVSSARP
jgi:sortase A